MTDGDAILAAILREPHDDFHRLAYADWLEENGDEDRAEFIRAQVELEDVRAIEHTCGRRGEGETTCPACGAHPAIEDLERREWDLFARNVADWLPRVPGADQYAINQDNKGGRLHAIQFGQRLGRVVMFFARGFLFGVHCSCADWMAHGPTIMSRHPVTSLVLDDKRPEPFRDGEFWRWFDGGRADGPDGTDPSELPTELWQSFHGTRDSDPEWEYPSEGAALTALSAGALNFARQKAAAFAASTKKTPPA